jgi:hypothetical protein
MGGEYSKENDEAYGASLLNKGNVCHPFPIEDHPIKWL